MRRSTFDRLTSSAGLVVAIVLVAAGFMLSWGAGFAKDNVRTQLSQQQIVFPTAGSPALADPAISKYLTKYSGQTMTTGTQAKAYADHFIAIHLKGIGGGKTYSQLSTQAQANPNDTALAATVSTMFRGETLRSLLLSAYAFWQLGQIATYGALGAFIAGALILLLAGAGMWHATRKSAEHEMFEAAVARHRVPATAH